MAETVRFDRFALDLAERRLTRDGAPVELNARYLDALALLVREQGRLVTKERFLDEVWLGVPVTDEALTQCISTLRRALGDEAGRPRFIETVPKHGYRFIAEVRACVTTPAMAMPAAHAFWLAGGAGTIGGGVAGAFGGLFYGVFGAAPAGEPGMGAASVLLVLMCLTMLVGVLGGAGVSFGIAAAARRSDAWTIAGAALGGCLVGAAVKLIGLDAFNLLFGQTPGEITGGAEGAVLGAAAGLGAVMARRAPAGAALGRAIAPAAAAGAIAGVLIQLAGGRLMAGSLDLLAERFPASRLHMDAMGRLFGESGFGMVSRMVTGGAEGLLFASFVVGAITLARRAPDAPPVAKTVAA